MTLGNPVLVGFHLGDDLPDRSARVSSRCRDADDPSALFTSSLQSPSRHDERIRHPRPARLSSRRESRSGNSLYHRWFKGEGWGRGRSVSGLRAVPDSAVAVEDARQLGLVAVLARPERVECSRVAVGGEPPEGLGAQGDDSVAPPVDRQQLGEEGAEAFLDRPGVRLVARGLVRDGVGQQRVLQRRLEAPVRLRRRPLVPGLIEPEPHEPPPAPISGWPSATSSLPRSRPKTQTGASSLPANRIGCFGSFPTF